MDSVNKTISYLNNQIRKLEEMKKSGISYVKVMNRNKALLKNIIKNIYCTIFKTRYRKEYTNVHLHGSALFFSRLYIEKYSNSCFEPEVFYYGEEDLLFYKCMLNGDKMMYSPKIKVIHLTGASANKSLGARNDIDRELFNYRSELSSKKVLLEEIKKYNGTLKQN